MIDIENTHLFNSAPLYITSIGTIGRFNTLQEYTTFGILFFQFLFITIVNVSAFLSGKLRAISMSTQH